VLHRGLDLFPGPEHYRARRAELAVSARWPPRSPRTFVRGATSAADALSAGPSEMNNWEYMTRAR